MHTAFVSCWQRKVRNHLSCGKIAWQHFRNGCESEQLRSEVQITQQVDKLARLKIFQE